MRIQELSIESEHRLNEYVDRIGGILRNKKQRASFAIYATGLLSDGERKSVEPIAARACGDPELTNAVHHQLIHFLASSPWQDAPIRSFAARYAIDAMQARDPIGTWIVDDTGWLKQGKHSPCVQRQYTGSAGKITNCQIGVSLSLANAYAQVPVDFALYMPQSWADDLARRRAAHIPDDLRYTPKWCLALGMIEDAVHAGLPKGVVLGDSDYGTKTLFRDTLDTLELQYALEVHRTTMVRRARRNGSYGPRQSVTQIGAALADQMRTVTWREGTKETLHSRFARIRVVVERDDGIERAPQWLLVEWPRGEDAPTKFVLSTMPERTSCKQLVRTFKCRWRTERAYEDLKGELGIDHFEGRSFIGWHHHVTVVLACYAFLIAEQARAFSPSASGPTADHPLAHAA